jgi:hypothetical protein
MRVSRTIAAGIIGLAVTGATLVVGTGSAAAATGGCPNAWKTGVGVPVPNPQALPYSLAEVDVTVGTTYQTSTSNPGDGVCVAFWNFNGITQVYSVAEANSPDGSFLIVNGTPTKIPVP